jgi:hypothetical protein
LSINGGFPLQYNDNNTFEYGLAATSYHFTLQPDGLIKLIYKGQALDTKRDSWEATKEKQL